MNQVREQFATKKTAFIFLMIGVVLAITLPVFVGGYVLHMTISILILALFSLSVNLLLGYTGLLSFGQAGFYVVGAYGCAKLLILFPNLPLLGIFGGMAMAVVASILLGFLCVRHTAIYFSMLTLALGMMIYSGIRKIKWLGGGYGLPDLPIGTLFGARMDLIANYYYFVIIVAGIAFYLFYRLVHSPLGLTFQAIRDAETRVAFTGISVRNHRLFCFAIAGAYAGLAGALRAVLYGSVYPLLGHWSTSAEPVIASLLGGMHTFAGPLVGAAVFYAIKDLIFRITDSAWQLPMGIMVVFLALALRGGIVGSVQKRLLPWIRLRFRSEGNDLSGGSSA